jgi:hypothetical protein
LQVAQGALLVVQVAVADAGRGEAHEHIAWTRAVRWSGSTVADPPRSRTSTPRISMAHLTLGDQEATIGGVHLKGYFTK